MAVCCFTPALVLLFAVLGISSLIGAWLNPILLPALTTFLYLTT
jgi:mercuric ion transport protein